MGLVDNYRSSPLQMKKEKTEDGDGTETRQVRRDPMAGLEERQVKEEIEE